MCMRHGIEAAALAAVDSSRQGWCPRRGYDGLAHASFARAGGIIAMRGPTWKWHKPHPHSLSSPPSLLPTGVSLSRYPQPTTLFRRTTMNA